MSGTLSLGIAPARPLMDAVRGDGRAVRSAAVSASIAVALAAMLIAAYALTVAPDIHRLDSPELSAAAHRLGIAHAPGYPLYTMSGWLFSHAFPVSNVAFRLNLFSALLGAAACVVVYAAGLRLTARPLVAAAGALALGLSYQFWRDALVAEVYTLDALLVAAIVLAAMAWRSQPGAPRAVLLGLAVGLCCANRTTSLLYVPAVAAFMWLSIRPRPLVYAAGLAGLAAGLAPYAYLPLRAAAGVDVGPGTYALDGTLHVIDLTAASGLWRHVSAAEFRTEAFAYGPLDAIAEAGQFGWWLTGTFLLVGLPLGIAGIVRQWRRDRALLVLLAGMAMPVALFFINYGALDKELMFLPAYVIWGLWMVAGMDWAVEAAQIAPGSPWTLALLALPLAMLLVNAPLVSLRGDRSPRTDAEAMLAAAAPGALVIGRFTDTAPLAYLQQVDGQRPDVRVVNTWTAEPGLVSELVDANVGRGPVYLTQRDAAVCARHACAPAGPLVEVRARAP